MTDAVLSAIIEFSTERLDCNNVNELSILFFEHKIEKAPIISDRCFIRFVVIFKQVIY